MRQMRCTLTLACTIQYMCYAIFCVILTFTHSERMWLWRRKRCVARRILYISGWQQSTSSLPGQTKHKHTDTVTHRMDTLTRIVAPWGRFENCATHTKHKTHIVHTQNSVSLRVFHNAHVVCFACVLELGDVVSKCCCCALAYIKITYTIWWQMGAIKILWLLHYNTDTKRFARLPVVSTSFATAWQIRRRNRIFFIDSSKPLVIVYIVQ